MHRIDADITNPQLFPSEQLAGALGYLNRVRGPCIVAAPDWFSTMIPAYTSCRSISGHRLVTYANDAKIYEMNEFFFSGVPLERKAMRLRQYGVTHVVTLVGITGSDILPLFAPEPDYRAGGVRVWRVRQP